MTDAKGTSNINPNSVAGQPTKSLFISMLVKDITLKDAIGDLVDNSVDGAKKSASDDGSLRNFEITLSINKDTFSIHDNCGGIESTVARTYAFRFGRPDETQSSPGSIGQFGIGMKRAFFKIGNMINVKSVASTSDFELEIDVDKWKNKKDSNDWNFEFKSLNEGAKNSLKQTRTDITIKSLNSEPSNSFNNPKFVEELVNEIALEQTLNIEKGLKIKINEFTLKAENLTLKVADDLKPSYWSYSFDDGLNVEVVAGISTSEGAQGGWYIFCNDRLIMGHDTSKATGWGREEGQDGVALYHQQFYRFRGYVFFSSDDSSKLPWNTTKTGMNLDSPAYQTVRTQMVEMMKQVMSLMNKLKKEKEKDNPKENQVLNNRIDDIKPVRVTDVLKTKSTLSETFAYPAETNVVSEPNSVSISYKVPKDKFNKVKKRMQVSKATEVGIQTFNYYIENEIEF